jgi:hypothetical protein
MSSESYRIDYWDPLVTNLVDKTDEADNLAEDLTQDFAESKWSLKSNLALWIIPLILSFFGILMIASLTSQGGIGITSPYGLPI